MTLEKWLEIEKSIETKLLNEYKELLTELKDCKTKDEEQMVLGYVKYSNFTTKIQPNTCNETKVSTSISSIEKGVKYILNKHPFLNKKDITLEYRRDIVESYYYLYYSMRKLITEDELKELILSEQKKAFGYHYIQITMDLFKQNPNNPLVQKHLEDSFNPSK
jgi:hypothetical protein